MTANEIRESYKQFFASKGHTVVPSAPMVIKDDPTLMFTNAGMNQWKDIILGTKDPEPRRRADSQKCLRVSGKHNDLEEVGHDTYHHTMFEMLGNWSFGDYFKEEAIDYAWEYLVDVLHLDPKDLTLQYSKALKRITLLVMMMPLHSGESIFLKTISSTETSMITSGKWAIQVLVDPVQRYISTQERQKRS